MPDDADRHLHVEVTPSAAIRLTQIQQRMWLITAMVAGLFLMIPVFYVLSSRPNEAGHAGKPQIDPRVEMRALEHLVRISEDRSSALEREASARKDAEHNLQLSQSLLDESVEQRTQLGRDLHDNLCQTLYAVALSIEGAQKRLRTDPDDAGRSLAVCIEELRAANRNVRAYIAGLMSRETELQTFKGALESMIESFSTLTGIQLKGSIDAEAADSLNRAHSAEVLQIVREAVSNSIRHAQAEEITVSVRPDNGRVSIVVADDGKGFDPHAPTSGGYGMANMQARAEALGGAIHIESSSDTGTRIRVELPKQA
jgi:signal transduction histidine kinase